MLILDAIFKSYTGRHQRVTALHNISLRLARGTLAVLRGPSGCGKTTLLLTAGGLLAPDSGRVQLDNQDVYALRGNQRASLRAVKLGFVFQQFHLLPYLSVTDNLLAAVLAQGQAHNPASRQRAAELLEHFGLTSRAHHLPEELSTGEKQRTALARAMMHQPALLLADEPTGNLDEDNARIVLEALEQYARAGNSVLLASHDERITAPDLRVWRMAAGALCD